MINGIMRNAVFLLFVLSVGAAHATEPRDFLIRVKDLKTGAERYQTKSTLRESQDQPGFWLMESRGQGTFHNYSDAHWLIKTKLMEEEGRMIPVQAQWDIYQGQRLVESWSHRYDLEKKEIIFLLAIPQKGIQKQYVFPIKGLTTDYTSLALFLESFVPLVKPGQPQVFLLLTSEPRLFRVNMKYLKEEDLTLGSKIVRAIKYRLIVDMGIVDDVFDRWIPPTYIWYEAKPPHHWLKYQGMETGEGSALVDAELMEEADRR